MYADSKQRTARSGRVAHVHRALRPRSPPRRQGPRTGPALPAGMDRGHAQSFRPVEPASQDSTHALDRSRSIAAGGDQWRHRAVQAVGNGSQQLALLDCDMAVNTDTGSTSQHDLFLEKRCCSREFLQSSVDRPEPDIVLGARPSRTPGQPRALTPAAKARAEPSGDESPACRQCRQHKRGHVHQRWK